jgi:ATP-dependent exoDNAse (exonuclease V) beta subunit
MVNRNSSKSTANNSKVPNNCKAPSVYQFLKDLEAERSDNEIVRLLYVAATRTQRQLHLIASIQTNKKGEIKPAAKSLLKVLWPAVEADFINATPFVRNDAASAVLDITQFKPQLQRLDSHEFSGELLEIFGKKISDFANSVTQLNDNSSASIASSPLISSDLQRHCGTLAHLYMSLFAISELSAWNAERIQQCQPAMQKWLVQQGHSVTSSQHGAAQVVSALQATLNSEAGQWVLQKHVEAASELSVMQAQDEGVKNHVIDRTFIEKGTRWIVDYKLTALGESMDLTLAAEQHRPQLERYAGLFGTEALPIKKAVLFLSVGQLVAI